MKCIFCGGIPLVGSDPRCCSACAERLNTHTAHICTACNTCYWMQKSPENVMFLASSQGIEPQYIMTTPLYFWMKVCKACLAPLRKLELVHSAKL